MLFHFWAAKIQFQCANVQTVNLQSDYYINCLSIMSAVFVEVMYMVEVLNKFWHTIVTLNQRLIRINSK